MRRFFDNSVSLVVIIVVLFIIIPLPPFMLDILLLVNISISLMILLITMYVKESLDFSIFPSLLLITTLFRLGLNLSSTKLILGQGGSAGAVIETFGNFVIGGEPVVGFIIFLIIVIIQFMVITKGAERVAEVSARFTLDAMPGKQMAIDADLNTGAINEAQARERREKISREAEFYGSMDGATKFVKGDAVVSLIISLINLVGGIIIGYMNNVEDVMNVYTIATVGDGLVSQIPALLISTATGMIVTRAASKNSLSKDVIDQFSSTPIALIITGALMLVLMLIPGFPPFALLFLGALMLSLGIVQIRAQRTRAAAAEAAAAAPDLEQPLISPEEFYKEPDNIYSIIEVHPISIEYGYSLMSLFNESQGSNIEGRAAQYRKKFAEEMGVVLPHMLMEDNLRISPNAYVIKIKGEEVASGELLPGYFLIMDSSGSFGGIDGIDTIEPIFGMPAKWVSAMNVQEPEMLGYTVIDPISVMIAHLGNVIKKYVHEIIGRTEINKLLERIRNEHAGLIEEIIGPMIPMTSFQRVIANLLREQIPVKDLLTILETIAEYAPAVNGDPDLLTEYCRQALRRTITRLYSEDGTIRVLTLDTELENAIQKSVRQTSAGIHLALTPAQMQGIYESLAENLKKLDDVGAQHIILTSPGVRIYFKQFIEQFMPDLTVLSYSEIDSKTQQIQSFGVVRAA